ncbi:MAG: 30S ribosomal protein S8 [Patescibacteria group bacterium]|nr:30S ribosomal protein S8 [Patescibacteria group bacterium]
MGNSAIDLIIRIKNGYLAKKEMVESPYSRFREAILVKLKELKFIKDFKVSGEKIKKIIIELFYHQGNSCLTEVEIISKPGRKIYVSYRDLKPVLNGFGYSILSTPQGIITDKEAKRKKVGGELLFNIW